MERTRQRPEQIQGGSRTITIEDNQQDVLIPPSQNAPPVGVLQLRASGGNTRRVVWSEETIDNEGMGKKKSKICCIYHKPKAFDESSDESSGSNSESEASNSDKDDKDANSHSSNSIHDSDSEKEDEVNASKSLRDRKANGLVGKGKAKANNGVDDENCGVKSCKDHHHKKKSKQKSTKVTKGRSTQTITITENENENHDESTRKVKPNAYEKGIW